MTATAQQTPRLYRFTRHLGWHRSPGDSIKGRIYHLLWMHHPWWDWGHRVMVLVGQDNGGNYDSPSPRTIWYREGKAVRMWRTKYPTHPPRSYQIVKSYTEFMALTKGIDKNSDAHYEWRAICAGQDGNLHLGRQYWGGDYYGLDHWEMELLRRWLNRWRWRNWFGLRSWLYSQALEAAVAHRKPFSCQQTPPKGQGYSHWHCQERKRHDGPHRFRNAEWGVSDER